MFFKDKDGRSYVIGKVPVVDRIADPVDDRVFERGSMRAMVENLRRWMSIIPVLLLVGTFTTGVWTKYGWVTKDAYAGDTSKYASLLMVQSHINASTDNFAAQDKLNKDIGSSLNEIKALLKVVPQLKALIRNRCNGVRDLQETINSLKYEYRMLTGTEYIEPACDSPELIR